MDNKVKWGLAICGVVLSIGLYLDNRPAQPIDFENPATLSYRNIERHANNNVAAAQYVLGTYYLKGYPPEVKIDSTKAAFWFKKAADNEHSTAAFDYAQLMKSTNPEEAEKYYRQSMAKGYAASIFALAQLKLHQNTPASIQEGLKLIYAASSVQDPLATAYLASLLHEGAGIKQDRVAALLTIQKAAAIAPTPETKKDWDAKYKAWFDELDAKEQERLNEQLMLGNGSSSSPALTSKEMSSEDISALLSNLPINGAKPVSK